MRIAIDGPASSGKGTVARLVARTLSLPYIDTGAMYRAVGLFALEQGVSLSDGPALAQLASRLDFSFSWDGTTLRLAVNGRDITEAIRTEVIGRAASDVAAIPDVRRALLERQRALAREEGVVMDGRDIGTVVLPDAELKIYLDASLPERARRRARELKDRGDDEDTQEIMIDLKARDAQDSGREVAPLKQADDAVYIDTTTLTTRQACDQVVALARALNG